LKTSKNLSSITLFASYSGRSLNTKFSELQSLKKIKFDNFCLDQAAVNEISSLKNIEELDMISSCFPEDIDYSPFKNLKDSLQTFLFNGNDNISLQEAVLSFTNLKKLSIKCDTTFISQIASQLENLEYLILNELGYTEFPESISSMENLKYLDLSDNYITEIPESIIELKSLELLNLENNSIKTIPEGIEQLSNLKISKPTVMLKNLI